MKVRMHGSRNENKMAITFDDGPNPFWTPKILNILDEYGVKANFFVIGRWAEKHPEIVREIFNRGHLIGNHTYSHSKKACCDFDKADETIFNILNIHTEFIRPPYFRLKYCLNYKPPFSREAKMIGGDIPLFDWITKSEGILNIAKHTIRKGSIIVLHDGSEKRNEQQKRPERMVNALPKLIEVVMEKKLRIARLDELAL
ncbi:MAG: polysaccharide deacetylase family protein [Candidatus Pacebacteria bacterium]|nr:polysaccharide deacetylase family protein [Candidatus Paceibacterota bacterium]